MVKSEDRSFVKVEKGSPPPEDQTNNHFDHNWVDIKTDILHLQTCNGPGVPLPTPYFNSLAAGYVSPFHSWALQQTPLPPHGVPYPAIHSQNLYAHSAYPFMAVPSNVELLSSSPKNIHKSSSKRFKEFDEPAVQVGYWDSEDVSQGSIHKELESVDGINSSSDGNNANSSVHERNTSTGTMSKAKYDTKTYGQVAREPDQEACIESSHVFLSRADNKILPGKSGESISGKADINVFSETKRLPLQVLVQDDRQLKREGRKLANRESAVRSRLKEQAEVEELMTRHESIRVENVNLKSELGQLREDLAKSKLENAKLTEKLNRKQLTSTGGLVSKPSVSSFALHNDTQEKLKLLSPELCRSKNVDLVSEAESTTNLDLEKLNSKGQ